MLLAAQRPSAVRSIDQTFLGATATADTRVLRFYQLLGFRPLRVERDVFTPEVGHPEIDVDGVRHETWPSHRAAASAEKVMQIVVMELMPVSVSRVGSLSTRW